MQTLRRLNLSLVLLALVFTIACSGNVPPNLTPEGSAAFQKTRVIKSLDVLRDFAIDAEAQTPKVLSTDTTRRVVTYHQSALRVIQSTDAGWAAAVKASLDEVVAAATGAGRAGCRYLVLHP